METLEWTIRQNILEQRKHILRELKRKEGGLRSHEPRQNSLCPVHAWPWVYKKYSLEKEKNPEDEGQRH